MNAHVIIPAERIARAPSATRSAPQQHADQTFPYVLVVSTAGAVVVLASVLLTALALS